MDQKYTKTPRFRKKILHNPKSFSKDMLIYLNYVSVFMSEYLNFYTTILAIEIIDFCTKLQISGKKFEVSTSILSHESPKTQ